MANEKFLKFLNQGVEACNKWREENPEIEPGLYAADLERAELAGLENTSLLLRIEALRIKT